MDEENEVDACFSAVRRRIGLGDGFRCDRECADFELSLEGDLDERREVEEEQACWLVATKAVDVEAVGTTCILKYLY